MVLQDNQNELAQVEFCIDTVGIIHDIEISGIVGFFDVLSSVGGLFVCLQILFQVAIGPVNRHLHKTEMISKLYK